MLYVGGFIKYGLRSTESSQEADGEVRSPVSGLCNFCHNVIARGGGRRGCGGGWWEMEMRSERWERIISTQTANPPCWK